MVYYIDMEKLTNVSESPEIKKWQRLEISPEAQKRAEIIKLFREKFKPNQNIVIEPEKWSQWFIVRVNWTILLNFNIYISWIEPILSLRSIESKELNANTGIQKTWDIPTSIELTEKIVYFIDVVYNPKKYGIKQIELSVQNWEALIIGTAPDLSKYKLTIFEWLIPDIQERNMLIMAITKAIQKKTIPIPTDSKNTRA